MSNQLRFIKNVIYRMKRRYGCPVNFIKILTEVVNLETGVKTLTRDSLIVQRVIPLPSTIAREFFYDLAFITQNKDFTYGGSTLSDTRKFLVDRSDLGSWVIKVGDIIIYSGKRYGVTEVKEYEQSYAYIITAKESESVQLDNVISVSLFEDLGLSDSAVNS